MSFPNWLVDASANRTNKSYLQGFLDISGNLYIRNGKIQTPMNSIEFNDTTGYINISNLYLFNNLLIYNPTTTSNIDLVAYVNSNNTNITSINSSVSTANGNITTLQTKTTNQTFASNTTTWTGSVVFPAISIASTSINNSSFCDLTNLQTIAGIKTFSSAPVLSGASITSATIPITSIVGTAVSLNTSQTISGQKQFSATPLFTANVAVYGNMLLNNLALTITQATLQKIQFLSNVSSDIQTSLNSMISLSANNTYTGTNTYNNNIIFTGLLNNKTAVQFSYLDATSSIQFQLDNKTSSFANNAFTGSNSFVDITYTGLLNNKSTTTFGYLDATSSIQTQLNSKIGLSNNNTLTGNNIFTGQLSSLYNASGTIYGSQTELFLEGHKAFAVGGDPTLGTNVFEISLNTTGNKRGCVWQGGESETNSAAVKRSVFGLFYRSFVGGATRTPIMYGTDQETGSSLDNTLTIPSSLRMTGILKLSGGSEISNTQLGYLTTLSENVQSAVDTLKTKLTDLVWTAGSPNVTSIVNTTQTATLTFSNTLNGISTGVFSYLSGVTSSIQDQFTSMKARTPVGSIIMYLKGDLGSPFIFCDGRELNRGSASLLFAVIGTTYGAGDGSTTFNIPDLTAVFVRGFGSRTINGIAYASTTGSTLQIDAMEAHTHASNLSGTFLKTGVTFNTGFVNGSSKPNESAAPASTGGVNAAFRTSNETRPINLPVYYYICAG